MTEINWMKEVEKRQDDLIKDLQGLLHIKSVLDEENTTEDAPLGKGVKEALDYLLDLGSKDGFISKNVGNLAGHLEMGEGEELVGILCHVDVVPEGDGWSVDPYSGVIKDGKIFARGSSDDKGPTMAAYYGMKIVKELGLPLEKRVRLIVGTDEESNGAVLIIILNMKRCLIWDLHPMVTFLLYMQKKAFRILILSFKAESACKLANVRLISFHSGRRYNMVPDHADSKASNQWVSRGTFEGVSGISPKYLFKRQIF